MQSYIESQSHYAESYVWEGGERPNMVSNLQDWITHTQQGLMETQWVGVMPEGLAYFSQNRAIQVNGYHTSCIHWITEQLE